LADHIRAARNWRDEELNEHEQAVIDELMDKTGMRGMLKEMPENKMLSTGGGLQLEARNAMTALGSIRRFFVSV
jgi:hypothetical protein